MCTGARDSSPNRRREDLADGACRGLIGSSRAVSVAACSQEIRASV